MSAPRNVVDTIDPRFGANFVTNPAVGFRVMFGGPGSHGRSDRLRRGGLRRDDLGLGLRGPRIRLDLGAASREQQQQNGSVSANQSRPVIMRTSRITMTSVRPALGATPQLRLCGHAGIAPTSISTRMTIRMVII